MRCSFSDASTRKAFFMDAIFNLFFYLLNAFPGCSDVPTRAPGDLARALSRAKPCFKYKPLDFGKTAVLLIQKLAKNYRIVQALALIALDGSDLPELEVEAPVLPW